MTKRRDLKRRVRERSARTGETYTTARRHVLAARPATDNPSVTEMTELTELAARRGFRCRIAVHPDLLALTSGETLLAALSDALVRSAADVGAVVLFGLAFGVSTAQATPRDPEPLHRIGPRAASVAFEIIAPRGAIIEVVCRPWHRDRALTLWQRSAPGLPPWGIEAADLGLVAVGPRRFTLEQRLGPAVAHAIHTRGGERPALFVIFDGERYPVVTSPFHIGRLPRRNHLALGGVNLSRQHAAVLYRNGAYYLKDLDSANGITHRGMRIDNKRIQEGDEFELGGHTLRFTFQRDS